MNIKRVGILLFNEVEVLDFAGPFEVFSISESPSDKQKLFEVVTIAEKKDPISALNGLRVLPDFTFADVPDLDVLLVPGGYGAEQIEISNPVLLEWLKDMESKVDTLASICTGAFLLAESGVLQDHKVTTHWLDIEELRNKYPRLTVVGNTKFVDQGSILTAGGISAGIELALYLVARYAGTEVARFTARRMEYDSIQFSSSLEDESRFPDFMKRPENRIDPSQQNTEDIEGYYYTAKDGSQMAFWECRSDRISGKHVHSFDEYTVCLSGEYVACFEDREIVMKPGDELYVPKGTVQWGRCKAGTRTLSAFGGKRIGGLKKNRRLITCYRPYKTFVFQITVL